MDLKTWLNTTNFDERAGLAKEAGTSIAYLWQISGGHSRPSWVLSIKLEKASKKITPDRVISKTMLRPDIAKAFSESR